GQTSAGRSYWFSGRRRSSGMSIVSGAEALPRKNRRVAKRNVEGDISPGLRTHVTQAAKQIRGAHKAELSDVLKADRAGRLFSSIIGPNGTPVGPLKRSSGGSSEGVAALAGEFGGLLGDAIRAGTGLLEGSLTVLTRAWITTVMEPPAKPNLGMSSSAEPTPEGPSQLPQSAAPQMSNTTVDTADLGDQAPEMPTSSPEELMLRGVLRQFMPMLLTDVNQGGDGYGLARTVIALFGRSTYDQASSLGKDKIMQLIKREPDPWAQVAPIEARFNRFLDEFTGYDETVDVQPRKAVPSESGGESLGGSVGPAERRVVPNMFISSASSKELIVPTPSKRPS